MTNKKEIGACCLVEPLSIMGISLILMILMSAFFSSAETAFSSVNKIRLRNYAEEKRRGAKHALQIAEKFDETITTILVGNNIVNIASATLAVAFFSDVLPDSISKYAPVISTAVMTIVILIFGEILPKTLAKKNSEKVSMMYANILLAIIIVLKPITWIFVSIQSLLTKKLKTDDEEPSITEDELEHIIDTMKTEGTIDQEEQEMIQGVLNLSERKVKEILTPRVDIVAIDLEKESKEIFEIFKKEKYSRIPIYENDIDHIVGILHERDFLNAIIEKSFEDVDIRELMKKPLFVSHSMYGTDLLEQLQVKKQHMAVVSDEYGGTAGIVTMEDLLEELVGEIYDEHDVVEFQLKKISENECIAHAEIDLEDVLDLFELNVSDELEHKNLGSWLYEELSSMPEVGSEHFENVERFDEDKKENVEYVLKFTVLSIEERRMQRIKVELLEKEEVEEI